jgi:hypothetical protein
LLNHGFFFANLVAENYGRRFLLRRFFWVRIFHTSLRNRNFLAIDQQQTSAVVCIPEFQDANSEARVSFVPVSSSLIYPPSRFTVAPSSAHEPPVESGDAVRFPYEHDPQGRRAHTSEAGRKNIRGWNCAGGPFVRLPLQAFQVYESLHYSRTLLKKAKGALLNVIQTDCDVRQSATDRAWLYVWIWIVLGQQFHDQLVERDFLHSGFCS